MATVAAGGTVAGRGASGGPRPDGSPALSGWAAGTLLVAACIAGIAVVATGRPTTDAGFIGEGAVSAGAAAWVITTVATLVRGAIGWADEGAEACGGVTTAVVITLPPRLSAAAWLGAVGNVVAVDCRTSRVPGGGWLASGRLNRPAGVSTRVCPFAARPATTAASCMEVGVEAAVPGRTRTA